MRLSRFAAAALVVLAACQATETAEQASARMQAESDSARTAITAAVANFVAHFNAGHADTAAMTYTDNAVIMPPNAPTATGRAAIVEAMSRDMAAMPGGTLQITVQNVSANGDMAIDRGRWAFSATMGGTTVADSGKYLAHWHRVNGQWLMAEDIWNSDNPAEPPPPPRRR